MIKSILIRFLSYIDYPRVRCVSEKIKDAYDYSHPEFTLSEDYDEEEREYKFEYAKNIFGLKPDVKKYLLPNCRKGNIKVVNFLVSKLNVDITRQAIVESIEAEHFEITEFLIHNADKNILRESIYYLIRCTSCYRFPRIVEILVSRLDKEDLRENDNYLIFKASKYGNVELVKALVSKLDAEDLRSDDNFPILIASEKGHLEIVKILASKLNVEDLISQNYAIFNASCSNGHLEVVKFLISQLDDENLRECILELFFRSCLYKNIEIGKFIVSKVNKEDLLNYSDDTIKFALTKQKYEYVNFLTSILEQFKNFQSSKTE
jgi:hypothetical protein